jgi:hypothetical protein
MRDRADGARRYALLSVPLYLCARAPAAAAVPLCWVPSLVEVPSAVEATGHKKRGSARSGGPGGLRTAQATHKEHTRCGR